MEEFQRLSINLQDQKSKRETKPLRILGEDEVVQLLRISRETVEQLLERSSENVKIGQAECKSVRDLIAASLNLSPTFHPPSEKVLEEYTLLVDTLMVALASTKVPVESLILFGTALVQILVIGPCILKAEVCQKCGNLEDSLKIVADAHTRVKRNFSVEMEPVHSGASTLLNKIVGAECLIPAGRTDSFELTLCYAFIMSSTRLHNLGAAIRLDNLLSTDVYDIIFKECSNYSKLTTLAFKTLASWLEKVSEFGLSLNKEVTLNAFEITTSSWEVSLSGVRKDNAKAFSTLLSIDSGHQSPVLPSTADLLESVVKQQLWTDVSKYYTITEIVGLLTAPKVLEKYASEIVEGLKTSFGNNQLAAAGAHLYESLLRQLTLFYWNKYFLHPILELINEIDGPSARRLRKLQTDKVTRSATIEKVRTIQLNILNYWLRITANVFPDALITLRQETYEKLRFSEFKFHDHLSFLASGVLFVSRKKGLWDPLSDAEFPRMATYRDEVTQESFFKTICVSCKISDKIHPQEFEIILEFLRSHINVDSTRMRQEITRSMKVFFHRFHVSSVHHQKLKPAEDTSSMARNFLEELLNFLADNLIDDTPSGKRISYQRRIASLQIYLELLRSVKEVKNYKFNIEDTACAKLIKEWHLNPQQQKMLASCIDDQTDTVQNTAFSILKESINETAYERHSWLDIGIEKAQDPRSHVAQSGILYLLLATQSLYKGFGAPPSIHAKLHERCPDYNMIYSSADALNTPVTLLVFNIGLNVWETFKSKPMELTKVKSLHGIIDTMTALALKSEGPETSKLHPLFKETLLEFVENVSAFCVSVFMSSSENKDCAPSFAEMGIAIRNAAKLSDDRTTEMGDEDDELDDSAVNASSDERLLVKHLWMNLKACCNFAANVHGSIEITQKSLDILTHVLRRCRHKGAIEAAGESLQHLIGAITKVPKSGEETSSKQRNLPLVVLEDFLQDLASGKTAHKTSTTRRSAGLAIFVHHIVIGDADPEKPLLKVALSQLISALNTPISDINVNERDLPQAQTLHILRTLVADASLRVSVTPYINQIAQSALIYLTSTLWSVRNGALQLFGALVPILVGQESSLGQFHFLHKDLFESLLSFVEKSSESVCLLQTHNDAVPALVLLSRLTAPPALLSTKDLTKNVQRLKTIYFTLLGSEIMTVRHLAARGLAGMSDINNPSLTVTTISAWLQENPTQNAIHGALLAVNFLSDRCQPQQSLDRELIELINIVSPRLRSKLSTDLLCSVKLKVSNQKPDPENSINYLLKAPLALDIDFTRSKLENIIQQVLAHPPISSEALQAILTFISDHPKSSNDIIISALTSAQQIIILGNADAPLDYIEQLFELQRQWTNPSVRSAGYAVLLGLAKLADFKCAQMDDIAKSFVSELRRYCSFVGDRDPNNVLKMAEGLGYLSGYYHPTIARDLSNGALWFLQSEDSDIRDQAAETVARERLGHTECLLKLMDPGSIRGFCKTESLIALSLCDRLRFSDDELLAVLGEVRGSNVDQWRRENPFVEDWCVADRAYRQLDAFLNDGDFGLEEIQDIIQAVQLHELRPFIEECERVNICSGSTELLSAMKSSPFIKNHRKFLYRQKIQEKCERLVKN